MDTISHMSRQEIVEIFEQNGFAVYDNESYEDLKEDLRANVADGTIVL